MTKDDRNKLTKAGFTILRVFEEPKPVIKQMTEHQNWSIFQCFETKAAMKREIANINANQPKIIFE
jgi:hypothetical protein